MRQRKTDGRRERKSKRGNEKTNKDYNSDVEVSSRAPLKTDSIIYVHKLSKSLLMVT